MASHKIIGIVTDIIKHSDRHDVITLFTRDLGRLAFLSPSGKGKISRIRRAGLQPLSVISADINFKENRDLNILGSFSSFKVWNNLYFSPSKSAIVMLISEFLNRYLRDAAPDTPAWDYVYSMLNVLDNAKGSVANFHIAFLTGFLRFAGIEPDLSDFESDDWFDMNAGALVPERPPHNNFLSPEETAAMINLMRINSTNYMKFKFSGSQRSDIINRILNYYSIHFPGLSRLKSPAILSEIWK